MEVWKDIPGFEGLYQVSNLINFRSLTRISKYKERFVCHIQGRPLKTYRAKNTLKVTLLKAGHKIRRSYTAIKLAWLAFNGSVPEGMDVVAKDKLNVKHLVLMTKRKNMSWRKIGELNPKAKLSVKDVVKIRQEIKYGVRKIVLARQFNVSLQCIRQIDQGKSWRHTLA